MCRFRRNQCFEDVSRRSATDAGRKRWKDGGGHCTDGMFVPRDVSGQGHRYHDADPRDGPIAVPRLLGAEGAGTGRQPVL